VKHRMADGRSEQLHALGHRGCGLGAGSIRAPTWRLSADAWRLTGEPYVVLEVPTADLALLSPGFQTALDGLVPRLANPYARVELDEGAVTLILRGRRYGPVTPAEPWPHDGECQIFLVSVGRLPSSEAVRQAALVDAINGGEAMMAVNAICTP
jgi:hypothetical protein